MSQTLTPSVSATLAQLSGPAAPNASGGSGNTGSGSTILLNSPPPALSALATGQLIRAIAVGRTADGKILAETRFGTLALNLPNAPPRGSVFQLQIVKPGNPVTLQLVGGPEAQSGQTAPNVSGKPAQPQVLETGITITGRFVAAAKPAAAGTQPGGQAVGHTAGGAVQADAPAAKAGTQIAGQAASANTPRGNAPFHARVLAIHTQAPDAPHHDGDPVVTGRVVSSKPGGPTVLALVSHKGAITAADGRQVVLPKVGNAQKGNFVTLRIVAEPGTVIPSSPATTRLQTLTAIPDAWPALRETLNAVMNADPAAGQRFVSTALPTTGPQLTTGIALFLAVLNKGNLPEWLGRDVTRHMNSRNPLPPTAEGEEDAAVHRPTLRRTPIERQLPIAERGQLLARLSDDFSQLARMANEPVNNEWRVIMLPLMHDGLLQQVRMYLRGQPEEDAQEQEVQGTRFVIEAQFSKLGAMQFDGLARAKTFDLIVRTHAPLPSHVRADIIELFGHATREFQIRGRVDFKVQSPFPVAPIDEMNEHAIGVFA